VRERINYKKLELVGGLNWKEEKIRFPKWIKRGEEVHKKEKNA
jgi:hypothetical protein